VPYVQQIEAAVGEHDLFASGTPIRPTRDASALSATILPSGGFHDFFRRDQLVNRRPQFRV